MRTLFELIKNESLELENEKTISKNIRQATFIYLNPDQKNRLTEGLDRFGDEAFFKEGIQIGRLIKKDKNCLKFIISDAFDQIITAKEEDRIDLSEIQKVFGNTFLKTKFQNSLNVF